MTNVFAIVGTYCIRGELHLPTSRADSLSILTQQLSKFFPITRASLSGPGVKPLSVPVLFANKDFVSCFHIGESANGEDASVETATASPQPEESDSREESLAKLVKSFHGLLGEADSGTDSKVDSPMG